MKAASTGLIGGQGGSGFERNGQSGFVGIDQIQLKFRIDRFLKVRGAADQDLRFGRWMRRCHGRCV